MVIRNRWTTLVDTRSGALHTNGWTGAQKSGYSDVVREVIRKLNKSSEKLKFAAIFNDIAARSGYNSLSAKCCPQCESFIIKIQCCCLHCGMMATYQGGGAEALLCSGYSPSVGAGRHVESSWVRPACWYCCAGYA
jgi:nitrogenase molybdenum-iron protein alpha/beta subunit